MLHTIFLILLLQLGGEILQKYFSLTVPGPVIGLMLLLGLLLISRRKTSGWVPKFRQQMVDSAETLLTYLSLLFVPIGVGVIMHLQLLDGQLLAVLSVIIVGTIATLIFTAFLFQILRRKHDHD